MSDEKVIPHCLFVGAKNSQSDELRDMLAARAVTLNLRVGIFLENQPQNVSDAIFYVSARREWPCIEPALKMLRAKFPDVKLYAVAPFTHKDVKDMGTCADAYVHSDVVAGFVEVFARCVKENAMLPEGYCPDGMTFSAYLKRDDPRLVGTPMPGITCIR